MAIRTIFLDAGGVMVMPDSAAIQREIGSTFPPDVMHRAHYAGMHATDLARNEEFSWVPYNHAYVDVLDVRDVERARAGLNRAMATSEWVDVIDDARDALPLLAERAQLAVVSNSDGTVERLLADGGFGTVGQRWVCVVDSHIVGIAKPDPRIFEIALEATGTDPADVIHVGDSIQFDVEGARAAGIRPVHIDPYGMCTADDHDHIAALRDLLALV